MKQNPLHTPYRILFTSLLLSLYCILPVQAEAAELGLGVTKNTFDLEILPGDSYEGELTVFNESEEVPIPVHIQLSLWNLKEDSDDYEFVVAEPALNAAKWFEFEEGTDFILDPDGSRTVDFRIVPPRDVVLGSYLVMMRFQAVLPEHYFAKGGPRTIPELGVLFFIKIAPLTLDGEGGLYDADILEFQGTDTLPVPLLDRLLGQIISEAKAGVLEDMVRKFAAKIRNTGLYHFKASGTIEIKNMLGQTVAKAELPPRYLLPNRNRSFDIQVIEGEESFWRRNTYFGPYTAVMVLNIPESDTPVIMQEKFWVFPWKTVLLLVFLAVILLLLRKRLWGAIRVLVSGFRIHAKKERDTKIKARKQSGHKT